MVYLLTELRAQDGCLKEIFKGRAQDGYSTGRGQQEARIREAIRENLSELLCSIQNPLQVTLSQETVFTLPLSHSSLILFWPLVTNRQTLDLLFVNVGFIHCQLHDGRKKQVMHSFGLAPTLGSAGGGAGERRAGCFIWKMPETMWGTAILPATSKWETEALRCPYGSHSIKGWLESAVSDISLCIQAPLLTRPTARPGCLTHQAIVGPVSVPHQDSVICL